MITTNKNRITIGRVLALGFLMAALLAMLLAAAPASAAAPSGKAFGWGNNEYGQLGNGTSGDGTGRNTPGAIKNLSNVKNIDGGNGFTLAATGQPSFGRSPGSEHGGKGSAREVEEVVEPWSAQQKNRTRRTNGQ